MTVKKICLSVIKILVALVFWGGVWFAVSLRVNSDFFFPAPDTVGAELWHLIGEKSFWLTTCTSLLRVLWGISISWILGTLLAYLTASSRFLDTILSPAISAVKSTPVASFIILALLWMERGILPVFITALIVIPIVWANVSEGIRSVDRNLVEVATVYRFSLWKKLFRLYVPSVVPYFMAACKSSLGMAWKAGIAAEILATPDHSIGKELYYSKTYLETPTLFAWTLIVILLSLIIEKLLVYGLERLTKKLRMIPKGEAHAEH
ncbi:MAG: ABC transporter permease subunit [Clostridia bacterium]|nr:ABC transporter permease subunit [Clostridia bacterium]